MAGISDLIDAGSAAISGGGGGPGQDAATAVVGGARVGIGAAFNVGNEISGALIDGLMSPLGASGAALTDLAMATSGGVVDVLASAVEGAGDLIGSGTELVGKIAGGLGAAVGLAVGLVFGGPVVGLLIGGVSLLVGGLIGVVGSGLSDLVSIGGEAVGQLGETVGKGFETIITIVEDVFNAAISRARSVGDISYSTGMSFGQSVSTQQNFGALGIKGDKLAAMLDGPNMNPLLFQTRAGAFGLPGYDDPHFASSLANQYQQLQGLGPEGAILSRQMLVQTGLDNPAMRRAASMSPQRIETEQTFTRNLNSSMGLDPDAIRRFSEDFPLLINRIEQTADAIKIKFAGLLMDGAGGALLGLATTVSNNAEAIVGGLKTAATWIVTELPIYVLTGLELVLAGGQLFFNGISSLMGLLATELIEFSNGGGVIFSILSPIASAIDFITGAFKGLMQGLAPFAAALYSVQVSIYSVVGNTINSLKGLVTSNFSPVALALKATGHGDLLQGIRDFEMPTLQNNGLHGADMGAARDWANGLNTTDLTGQLAKLQKSDLPKDAAAWLEEKAPKFQNGAEWLGAQKERIGDMRDRWPEMIEELKRQNGALEKIADNTGKTADNTGGGLDIESFGRFFTNRTARGFANDLSRG